MRNMEPDTSEEKTEIGLLCKSLPAFKRDPLPSIDYYISASFKLTFEAINDRFGCP